jgi:hypothetical protein
LAVRLTAAAIWLFAGITKLSDLDGFRAQVAAYQVLPHSLVSPFSYGLPLVEVAIGGSGYSTSAVIRSTNGGASFAPENQGLPQTLVYALAYATDGTGDLYAGHQTGALRWHRASGQWENANALGSPITVYWSVEIVDGGGTARFGTYGRGIWDDHIQPVPSFTTYGTGKTSSIGTQPFLGGSGTPSLSSNDFAIHVDAGVPYKFGMMLDGPSQAQTPFQGGTLWIGPPIHRGARFHFDMFGYVSIPIPVTQAMVGTARYYQAWFRDPQHSDGTGVGLSNGGCAMGQVWSPVPELGESR